MAHRLTDTEFMDLYGRVDDAMGAAKASEVEMAVARMCGMTAEEVSDRIDRVLSGPCLEDA